MLELPATYIKLVLQSLLVHLVDVRAGVVFLMDNYRALTRPPRSYHSVEFRQKNSGPQLQQGKFGLGSGTIIGTGYIAVCDDQIPPIVL